MNYALISALCSLLAQGTFFATSSTQGLRHVPPRLVNSLVWAQGIKTLSLSPNLSNLVSSSKGCSIPELSLSPHNTTGGISVNSCESVQQQAMLEKGRYVSEDTIFGKHSILGAGAVSCFQLLLIKHLDVDFKKIQILDARDMSASMKPLIDRGARFATYEVTPDNYQDCLRTHLSPGGLLIDLSVNVQSADLIEWCHNNEVLYLNTALENWPESQQEGGRLVETPFIAAILNYKNDLSAGLPRGQLLS